VNKSFDKEVETWSGLYAKDEASCRRRYAIFQKNARERVQKRKQHCIRLLNPEPNMKILDIGCGNGIFRHDIVSKGACWIGLDTAMNMLLEAKKNEENNEMFKSALINSSGISLPFKDSIFQGILCVGMINFYQKRMIQLFLDEMHRVLAPGGVVILTSLRLDILTWFRSRLYPGIPLPISSPGPLYPHHYKKIIALVDRSRFECVEMIHVKKYLGLPYYSLFEFVKNDPS
jgi:cyclopropane fatty-acyl-phospholipid synthase-like methyltransferase